MTPYRWDRALQRVLSTILEPLGFSKAGMLCFIHRNSNCINILNFGGRVSLGVFKFTCTVGVRFPEIESRLHPDNHDDSYATVFTPIHFLHESRKFFEWQVQEPVALDDVANSAVQDVLRMSQPFFEKFSSLDNVERALNGPDAFRIFAVSPHQRSGVLAAIALINGRLDEAKRVLSDAMSDPTNNSAANRARIEELSQRLLP